MDNALTRELLLGVARHGLTTLGGALVAQGYLSATQADQGVGAILVLAGIAWSLWRKYARATATA